MFSALIDEKPTAVSDEQKPPLRSEVSKSSQECPAATSLGSKSQEFLDSLDAHCVAAPPTAPPAPKLEQGELQWMLTGGKLMLCSLLAMFWPLIIPSVLWFLPHATAGFICIFLSLIYWRFCHWNWPELQPGVYCHAGPKAQAIFHKAAPLWKAFRNYRAPFWLSSGDWTTTWPFVFFEPIAVEYSRKWVRPSALESPAVRVVLLGSS